MHVYCQGSRKAGLSKASLVKTSEYYIILCSFYKLQDVLSLRLDHRCHLSTPLLASEVNNEAADRWTWSSLSCWQVNLAHALWFLVCMILPMIWHIQQMARSLKDTKLKSGARKKGGCFLSSSSRASNMNITITGHLRTRVIPERTGLMLPLWPFLPLCCATRPWA